jgi:hypothetical protein
MRSRSRQRARGRCRAMARLLLHRHGQRQANTRGAEKSIPAEPRKPAGSWRHLHLAGAGVDSLRTYPFLPVPDGRLGFIGHTGHSLRECVPICPAKKSRRDMAGQKKKCPVALTKIIASPMACENRLRDKMSRLCLANVPLTGTFLDEAKMSRPP